MADTLRTAARTHDLIVTTGGVSVGEEDHSARALRRAGGSGEALKIALNPGKPALVGRIGEATYLGLPGNPVSALVPWSLLGRAVIARFEGRPFVRPAGVLVPLASRFVRQPGRTEFVPARLIQEAADTQIEVLPGSSARFRPLIEANGFAEVPADLACVQSGLRLRFHLFEQFLSC